MARSASIPQGEHFPWQVTVCYLNSPRGVSHFQVIHKATDLTAAHILYLDDDVLVGVTESGYQVRVQTNPAAQQPSTAQQPSSPEPC